MLLTHTPIKVVIAKKLLPKTGFGQEKHPIKFQKTEETETNLSIKSIDRQVKRKRRKEERTNNQLEAADL